MLTSIATGLIALCSVLLFWATVQHAWRRVFGEAGADPDVLVGRMGCQRICDTEACGRRCPKRGAGAEEEGS